MFDNDKSDEGQKLPGIPGSFGHEQRRAPRRTRTASSSREAQKAGRQATRARAEAADAAGETSRMPKAQGGPTFTGSGGDSPLGRVDLRKQTQTIMRRIKWTLRAGTILAIGLVVLGAAVGGDDDPSPRPEFSKLSERLATRATTPADPRAYFSAPRFQAAIDAAAREVSADDATVTRITCYMSNCGVTLQYDDETTHVSVDSELKTRTRDWGMPTDPGVKPSEPLGEVMSRTLDETERTQDVVREDLMSVQYSPDGRYGGRPGWELTYYVDGERHKFAAGIDGDDVRRMPERR